MITYRWATHLCLALISLVVSSCGVRPAPYVEEPESITILNWAGFLPEVALEAFTAETGIQVRYETYDNYETAADRIRQGQAIDVVFISNDFVSGLIREDRLAEIDFHNIPNFKNITANFRDLSLDPGNWHSVPWWWGTTGILYRTDLGLPAPRSWADLWLPEYQGHVALWDLPRFGVMLSLKALGYSANAEAPEALDAARAHLLELKPHVAIPPSEAPTLAPFFAQNDVWIGYGWAIDLAEAQALGLPVAYVLPEEGSLLWGETIVIPRSALNPVGAERFIDFLLRPEVSAQICVELSGNIPNEAALPLLPEAFRSDVTIFPPEGDLRKAEIVLPVSAETEARVREIWDEFTEGVQTLPMP